MRNNIAADYRRLGRFGEALEIDQRTFEDRRRILGANDPRTLNSHDMVAIDLRGLGRYQESLDIARKVVAAFAAVGGRENPDWLNARTGFAAALRKAGHHWDALQWSEEVVQRYRDYLGLDHAHTLRAAANLINDRRAVGELAIAEDLGLEICERSRAVASPVEIMYAAMVNLASVLRAAGRPEEARPLDLQARDALVVSLRGPASLHPGGQHQLRLRPGRVRRAGRGHQDRPGHPGQLPQHAGPGPSGHADGGGQPGHRRGGRGQSGTSGAAPRRRAEPVRGDADHGTSRGPSRSAGNQAHRGDRAVLRPARSLITRSLTWVISRIRSSQ